MKTQPSGPAPPPRRTIPKCIPQRTPDPERRRSAGISVLDRQHSSAFFQKSYHCHHLNLTLTKLHLIQRSTQSKAAVKKILLDLKAVCNQATAVSEQQPVVPIEEESSSCAVLLEATLEADCTILAELALDAYYKVVICKNDGILILSNVMTCYPSNYSIQDSCRAALSRLMKLSSSSSLL